MIGLCRSGGLVSAPVGHPMPRRSVKLTLTDMPHIPSAPDLSSGNTTSVWYMASRSPLQLGIGAASDARQLTCKDPLDSRRF